MPERPARARRALRERPAVARALGQGPVQVQEPGPRAVLGQVRAPLVPEPEPLVPVAVRLLRALLAAQ